MLERKNRGDILDSMLARLLNYGEVTSGTWPEYKGLLELYLCVAAIVDLGRERTDAATFLYALETAEKRLPADLPDDWHAELVDDMREQWEKSLGFSGNS